MKVSHILYKARNLDQTVKEFRDKGFTVEYGKIKNPYNAVVYFSEGPYLELLGDIKFPKTVERALRLFGKGGLVDRVHGYHYAPEGLLDICLENYKDTVQDEKNILKKHNQPFYHKEKNTRVDTHNRKLKYQVVFPYDIQLPFFMTYFTPDPKPKNYTHPNGVTKITGISFGTRKELLPIITELCDDNLLTTFIGEGTKDITYDQDIT